MSNVAKRDTGAMKMPSLPAVSVQDKSLANWVKTVSEILEVREGRRASELERAVTVRELRSQLGGLQALAEAGAAKKAEDGHMLLELAPGFTASVAVEGFAKAIIESRLFKQLNKSLDDESRFNHLAKEVRDVLTRSIAEEARARGAAVEQVQTIVRNNQRSLAMVVQEVTASFERAAAGVRSTQAAYADSTKAMATNVLQLQASLGNYLQDGAEGRASLEQEMTVIASQSEGLLAQYTMKIQAGGALAGYGLAAEEVNGKTSSAFIISAEKFAIVAPSYNGGLLTTPRPQDVVFGVDGNGIYLQNNVYLKGNLRVDGTGKKLADGLRGSLQITASGYNWSDTTARQAIWGTMGFGGTAPDNHHLVIGDMVTIAAGSTAITRYWNGSAWANPGAVFNGDLLVDGTVAARKINTSGLTVRDNDGNVILSANGMDATWLRNLQSSQVAGLGALATRNAAVIGSTVQLPDGTVMRSQDFVNRLSRLNSSNISTFMDVAAIGTAYIGHAAVGTLNLQGYAVTVPTYARNYSTVTGNGGAQTVVDMEVYMDQPGDMFVQANGYVGYGSGWTPVTGYLYINGALQASIAGQEAVITLTMSTGLAVGAGRHRIQMVFIADSKARLYNANVFAMGCKR